MSQLLFVMALLCAGFVGYQLHGHIIECRAKRLARKQMAIPVDRPSYLLRRQAW